MNRKTIRSVGVFVVTLLLSSATTAWAQGRGRGQAKGQEPAAKSKSDKGKEAKPPKDAKPQFGSHDRGIITDYYSKHSGLPPGLAKRNGDLPPGLEKQLRRNGTLPPGLQKRLRPFPYELERQLDPLPRGFRRGILDRHLVVYRSGDYTISDFFLDAVR